MTKEQFSKLVKGDLIKGQMTGQYYIVLKEYDPIKQKISVYYKAKSTNRIKIDLVQHFENYELLVTKQQENNND